MVKLAMCPNCAEPIDHVESRYTAIVHEIARITEDGKSEVMSMHYMERYNDPKFVCPKCSVPIARNAHEAAKILQEKHEF